MERRKFPGQALLGGERSELRAGAAKAALHGAGFHVKKLRCFAVRQALNLTELNGPAEPRRKVREHAAEEAAKFVSAAKFERRRFSALEELGESGLAIRRKFVERLEGTSPAGAEAHQSGVDDDAGKPGGKVGTLFELAEVPEGGGQRVLNGVFRVLNISEAAKSNAMEHRRASRSNSSEMIFKGAIDSRRSCAFVGCFALARNPQPAQSGFTCRGLWKLSQLILAGHGAPQRLRCARARAWRH